MGRYTGPKARVNRRLDFQVYENAGAVRASERKAYPPGQANRRKKLSNYGTANNEKQKIKHYYGLREKQLRHHFWLGLRGFAVGMLWLVVPSVLYVAAKEPKGGAALFTVIVGFLLTIVFL